jgi:hypothetical protein
MPSMHQTALAGLHLSRALLRRLVYTNKMSKADAAAVWLLRQLSRTTVREASPIRSLRPSIGLHSVGIRSTY